jgi:hypothetical protein
VILLRGGARVPGGADSYLNNQIYQLTDPDNTSLPGGCLVPLPEPTSVALLTVGMTGCSPAVDAPRIVIMPDHVLVRFCGD